MLLNLFSIKYSFPFTTIFGFSQCQLSGTKISPLEPKIFVDLPKSFLKDEPIYELNSFINSIFVKASKSTLVGPTVLFISFRFIS